MKINKLAEAAYNGARLRGHYQDETGITGRLAYIHRDIARSLDAHANGDGENNPGPGEERPSGPMAHLADAAIRTMTLSHSHGMDLEKAVHRKLRLEPEADDDTLARAAWNHYANREGDPGAARFEETIWDGHSTVAAHGGTLAREILNLEGFGVRPEPGDGRNWDTLANEAAEIFCWAVATSHQNRISLPRLIADIIAHDLTRSPDEKAA